MEVFGDEQPCACYKECQEFQKLVEFKDSGLVGYYHRPRTQDIAQAEAVESAGNTSRDAFIFCNKKHVQIATSELTSELEKENISCPRCGKLFEHAQKLIQEVKSIDKKMVLGICDHCRKKAPRSKQSFCVCDKIVKKFISVKGEQKEDTKISYKTLPLKMGHLRKHTMVNKENQNAYFDFQIDRGLDSPASRHEPEIQQMFSYTHFKSDETELGKTDLKEVYVKPAVTFTQPVRISSAHTPHEGDNLHIPGTPSVDSATTFGETSVGIKELPRSSLKDRRQGEIFEDIPSMDAKEALKRRHDFSLRQMMRLGKDSGVPYSVSKRPDIYETPKIAPWTQKEPTSKYYVESEMDMKIPTLRHDRGPHDPRGARDLDYVSNRDVKFRSRRATQDSFIAPSKADKYHHGKIKQRLYDPEEEPKQVKKLEDRYIVDEELKVQRSVDKISHKMKKPEQHVAISKSGPIDSRGNVLKHQYKIKQRLYDPEEEPKQVEKLEDRYIVDEELKLQRSVDKISHKMKKPEQHVAISKSGPIDIRENVLKHQYKIKQVLHDSEEKPKKVKKLEDRYIVDEELKLQRSVAKISHKTKKPEQHVAKSKSEPIDRRGNVLEYDYSFFFPKVMEKEEKKRKINISSSHLIKDTQEKFRLQAEREKKKQEEERQKKLEQAEKKKLAREEKRLQAEEKKRQAIEDQKKYEEEQRKLEEEQRKLAEQKNTEKDLKSKSVVKKNEQDKPRRDKSEEKHEIISKSKVTSKMLETDSRDKTDAVSEKNKIQENAVSEKNKIQENTKDVKAKPDTKGDDEITEKKSNHREKTDAVSEKNKIQENVVSEKNKIQEKTKDVKARPDRKGDDEITEKKSDHREKTNAVSEKNKIHENAVSEKNKIQENTKDVKAKPYTKGDDKITEKKSDHREKTDAVSEKNKIQENAVSEKNNIQENTKDVKAKPDTKGDDKITEKKSDHREKTDGVSKKGSKILLSETEQEDSEKAQTDLKAYEQKHKGVVKNQKIKPEKEDLHDKLQREKPDKANLKKDIEKLRKEKEARKAQDAKELDALSKKGKASKKTLDDAIKVSMSKIQKSLKKETSGKQETLQIKHEKGQEPYGKTLKKDPSKTLGDISELQKLQARHLKEKEEALKKKKQLEYEAKVAKAKEEAERNAQKDTVEMKRIKMLKENSDENLNQVIIKQAAKMGPFDIRPGELKIHKCHHQHSGKRSSFCHLCANSELELEVLSLDNKNNLTIDKTDVIIGEKIFKHKPRLEKIQEPEGVPILFQKEFCVEPDQQLKQLAQIIPQETKPEQKQIILSTIETEQGTGVIRYALSDRTFIDKGWTMLPTEKVMRKMNVYRMRPAHPEFDWFEHNKNKGLMTYDTGERLAEFDDNGRGRWYYRNGRLALDYYDAEETNTQQRFVIYSSGEPDERGRSHPITILATFDHQGNGIVFDHSGKIRLKYNQTEGVVLDRGIGPVSHWKWHSLNDPPVLQQVMIDTQMAHKDPKILKLGSAADMNTRPDNEEMLAIEFDNFIKEKSKKLFQKFKPFQIRMKALKINENFSLRVLDQATVYLIFRDGSTNLKLNIGMILDHQEIVDTDTAEVGEVSNSLERLPARTDSLAGLQRSVAHAQRYERQHAERERWLRPPEPCASADQLTAAASRPMRLPLRTVPTRSSSSTGYSSRKPTNNLYYDSRLRC